MNFEIYKLNQEGDVLEQLNDGQFPIFKLDLFHKEAGFAHLKLVTRHPSQEIMKIDHILLKYNNKILFKGSLQILPTDFKAEILTLNYLAHPHDWDEQIERIIKDIQKKHPIDPLFISSHTKNIDTFEAIPGLIEWNRDDHQAHYCDFLGESPIEMHNFFYDSLKIQASKKPYKAVEIQLHAHWMQSYGKLQDISEKLKQNLPNGLISTLTGQHLEKSWWKADKAPHNKSYYIAYSALHAYNPPLQQQNYFPIVSRKCKNNKHFRRYWFKPEVILGWNYQQPRHEILSFQISQGNTLIPADKVKTIHLTLNDVVGAKEPWNAEKYYHKGDRCYYKHAVYESKKNHMSSKTFESDLWIKCVEYHTNRQAHLGTFFTTQRGKQAADYALKIAQTHLMASARCLDVQFSCPLHEALYINTTSSIRLRDPRLPGGTCVGKVKSYRFSVDGTTGEALAHITIAISVGMQKSSKKVNIMDYSDQKPLIGICDPTLLSTDNIVESVNISNTYEEQEQILQNSAEDPVKTLNQHKTKIKIHLKDLHSEYPYTHRITPSIQGVFQARKQWGDI